MGFRGGGVKLTPPRISWFSSTPAEIGLTEKAINLQRKKLIDRERRLFTKKGVNCQRKKLIDKEK